MADAAHIQQALESRFDFLAGKIASPRARRVSVEVPADRLRAVLEFSISTLGIDWMAAITGLDEKESLSAIYHASGAHGVVVNFKISVPKERPVIRSVTDLFPACANYERELDDLLGFVVEGLPPGKRYPLDDTWPKDQKPLRKDWKKPDRAAP
jgi:Ni,Fe-hydrogenase III component G